MGHTAVSSGTILSRRGQQEGCHCVTGMQIWAYSLAMMTHLGCSSFFKQFLVKLTFRRDSPSAVVTLARFSHALVSFLLVENWTRKTWPYPPHFARVSLEYSLACWNLLQRQNFSWSFHMFWGEILVGIVLNYLLSCQMIPYYDILLLLISGKVEQTRPLKPNNSTPPQLMTLTFL